MKRAHLSLAALSLILLGACNADQSDWKNHISEAGNFSVSAPARMQEDFNHTDSPLGPIESHVFTLYHGASDYSIAYTDYPVPGIARANPVGALEGEMRRTLDSVSATLITQNDILLDDAPGIAFQGEFMRGGNFDRTDIVYGRVYLLDARLYQLMVVADKDPTRRADAQRFLASFRWLEPDQYKSKVAK